MIHLKKGPTYGKKGLKYMNTNNPKKEFHEALAAVVEYATVSGNQITKETIHTYFKDLIQDESMYEFIYKYLAEAKITVGGYEAPAVSDAIDNIRNSDTDDDADSDALDTSVAREAKDSPEASAFFEMYLADLKTLENKNTETTEKLIDDLLSGDTAAATALTEQYLPMVLNLTDKFENHGLTRSDLVAEGNLALYEAILGYADVCDNKKLNSTNSVASFEAHLTTCIASALKSAANEEIGSFRVSSHLADQVNALNDAATELAKDLGREATLEELCSCLSLGEDEVKELMRVSIQALTVVETE